MEITKSISQEITMLRTGDDSILSYDYGDPGLLSIRAEFILEKTHITPCWTVSNSRSH